MWLSRCAAALIAVLLPLWAAAQERTNCVQKYTSAAPAAVWSLSGALYTQCNSHDPAALIACALPLADAGNAANNYVTTGWSCISSDASGCRQIRFNITCSLSTCSPWTNTADTALRNANAGIPADDTKCPLGDCSLFANKKVLASASGVPDSFIPPNTPCLAGCAAFKTAVQPYHRIGPANSREYLIRYQMTGQACITETAPTHANNYTRDTKCMGGALPDSFCTTPDTAENCGFFNGKYVCMKSLGTDKCWVNTDGSRVCAEAAPRPPVPSNAAGTEAATPSQVVQSCTASNSCNTFNYYNSSVVAASGTATDGGGDPSNQGGTGTVGTGPGDSGDGTGTGTGTGGEGGPFTGPTLEEAQTFGEATDAFVAGIQSAGIVGAWQGIGSSMPAGSCPAATINVFGQAFSFTETSCQIWDDTIAPFLALVFLFVWPFIGLRIVMSA